MKRDNELLISASIYTLFIFLLINEKWHEADYIFQDRVPETIVRNLRKMGLKVLYVRSGETLGNGFIAKILRVVIKNLEYLRFLFIYKGQFKYRQIYGNDEVIQAVPFRNQGITLLEDGSFNSQPKTFFQQRAKRMHKYLLTRLFSNRHVRSYIPYGYSNYVKKIFLTSADKIDDGIKEKVKIVSLKELWEGKNEIEKSRIQSVFGLSGEIINYLQDYPNVLLTQPLCTNEGGFLSEIEKIDLYSGLLKDTAQEKLLIKTHYVEKTDYRKYFKNSLIIDQPIPFQFFELFNYSPSKVITISSSAALKYKHADCEVVFAGTEIDQRIVRMYGVVRHS